jgi:hypothetical protein
MYTISVEKETLANINNVSLRKQKYTSIVNTSCKQQHTSIKAEKVESQRKVALFER